MTPTQSPTLSGIRVPVEIANMAVQALQDRIATLEAAGQAKSAEIARLTAAGDAMYNAAVQDSTGLWLLNPFQDWAKAKEGRETK